MIEPASKPQTHRVIISEQMINRLKVGAKAVTMMNEVESKVYKMMHREIDIAARNITAFLFNNLKPSKELRRMAVELNKLVVLKIFIIINGGTKPIDHEQRRELRKLFGLPPSYVPDSDGLKKLNGLLKDVTGKHKFDAVEFLEDMRDGGTN